MASLGDPGLEMKKTLDIPGLGENVSGVAELWGFERHRLFQVEDIFTPKQIDSC
jgi:hypothetical protein